MRQHFLFFILLLTNLGFSYAQARSRFPPENPGTQSNSQSTITQTFIASSSHTSSSLASHTTTITTTTPTAKPSSHVVIPERTKIGIIISSSLAALFLFTLIGLCLFDQGKRSALRRKLSGRRFEKAELDAGNEAVRREETWEIVRFAVELDGREILRGVGRVGGADLDGGERVELDGAERQVHEIY